MRTYRTPNGLVLHLAAGNISNRDFEDLHEMMDLLQIASGEGRLTAQEFEREVLVLRHQDVQPLIKPRQQAPFWAKDWRRRK